MSPLEIIANGVNAISVLLAAWNSIHTWWTGIIGCVLFGVMFYLSQLYADATLQVFFIVTCILGWWHWMKGKAGDEAPIRRTSLPLFASCIAGAILVAGLYGWVLHAFTDAYMPFIDASVLSFSILAQFLLMARRIETWLCWCLVDTIAVPLFLSRGLYVTAGLYALFWCNTFWGYYRWRSEMKHYEQAV